jgi:ferric-dicitrate binding protein FerR (iron transport regulator)
MKEMKKREEFTDREWEQLASLLSGEKNSDSGLRERFASDGNGDVESKWIELPGASGSPSIDTDKAWARLQQRIESEPVKRAATTVSLFPHRSFMRIAAAIAAMALLGTLAYFIGRTYNAPGMVKYATGPGQKNLDITLPDGSRIYLNSNSEITFTGDFGKKERHISLSGEAYFEIEPDASLPFTIAAGEAEIRVVGTTFNVITSNSNSEVEVFVTSGRVQLSGSSGTDPIILEVGSMGRVGKNEALKTVNGNPNYLSWKTGHLEYNGQRLELVFADLKRAYDMNIVAGDPSLLDLTWTTAPIDNQPEETIINLICISFNLAYSKEGNVYHLVKK